MYIMIYRVLLGRRLATMVDTTSHMTSQSTLGSQETTFKIKRVCLVMYPCILSVYSLCILSVYSLHIISITCVTFLIQPITEARQKQANLTHRAERRNVRRSAASILPKQKKGPVYWRGKRIK